jgi:2,4-dienoyl-CoA reductase-like NADH-dependent reductase (Old Yellow Enzyme family)
MTEYPHLFTPLTVRGRTIPNRIVSTPHATGWELAGGLISTSFARLKVVWVW